MTASVCLSTGGINLILPFAIVWSYLETNPLTRAAVVLDLILPTSAYCIATAVVHETIVTMAGRDQDQRRSVGQLHNRGRPVRKRQVRNVGVALRCTVNSRDDADTR